MHDRWKRNGMVAGLFGVAALLLGGRPALAADWQAGVGAQNHDKGHQALAFLPNEIWIHQGDSITWTFHVDEPHTVTFLMVGQVRPLFTNLCGGPPSTSPATVDGTTCVTTDLSFSGQTFTAFFPTVGNYKLVCLLHEAMTGVVHVLAAGAPLPHDQKFYDAEAEREAHDLLKDADVGRGRRTGPSEAAEAALESAHGHHGHDVIAGTGEISATPGGKQTLSILRFMEPDIVIHAGETVNFDNHDPVTPHTITFGTEPGNPAQVVNALPDPDGALHATLNAPGDTTSSGFIVAAAQDQIFAPQTPLGTTRFRVTFTHAGTYLYICALHDDLGMHGRVIVLP